MLIDPFVIVAQIINFLILVALLKRFLFKPITQQMKARSQRIERQLAAAASKEQDAELEKKSYQQKQQELAAQKQEWLTQAKQEVELQKEELIQAAIADVNSRRSQWFQDFESDRHRLTGEIRDRLINRVTSATRKALSDLANTSLETQIVEAFINRLYNFSEEQLLKIRSLPTPHSEHEIIIRSSFEFRDEQKERLITAIREKIAAEAKVRFEIKADLICGIELRDRGYKISWNLEHYLSELEIATAKVLEEYNHQIAQ